MNSKKQENEEEIDQIETNEAPQRTKIDDIIDGWKDEAHRRDATPTFILYKFENPSRGTEDIFAGYFVGDEIPNMHQIGLLHGSGKYWGRLSLPKGTAKEKEQKTLNFKIHSIYDKYKAAADAEKQNQEIIKLSGGNEIQASGNALAAQSFLMVKEILSLILPVLKEANKPTPIPAQPPRQENAQEMLSSYTMMQKLLKANLFDTAETYREFSRRYQDNQPEIERDEDEPEPQGNGDTNILEKIIKMIEPFFGLIAQKSQAGRMAAAGLKAAPQFLEILQDPQLCRMIVTYFDKTKGKEQSDIALRNIGINRNQLFQQQIRTNQQAQLKPILKPTPQNDKKILSISQIKKAQEATA